MINHDEFTADAAFQRFVAVIAPEIGPELLDGMRSTFYAGMWIVCVMVRRLSAHDVDEKEAKALFRALTAELERELNDPAHPELWN